MQIVRSERTTTERPASEPAFCDGVLRRQGSYVGIVSCGEHWRRERHERAGSRCKRSRVARCTAHYGSLEGWHRTSRDCCLSSIALSGLRFPFCPLQLRSASKESLPPGHCQALPLTFRLSRAAKLGLSLLVQRDGMPHGSATSWLSQSWRIRYCSSL